MIKTIPLIILALIVGYACAWVGHFFFEHNKPATFK
ncbi:Mpo1-like protein [Endozoicomonas acroporae]